MAKKAVSKRPFKGLKSELDVPYVWIGSARQFKRLAELNRPLIEKERANRDITRNYKSWEDRLIPLDGFDTFLMGVAIENLLKGVLRAKGWSFKEVVSEGHHLRELYKTCCELCGLAAKNDECEALEKLEQFVTWIGKYNLPVDDLEKTMEKWGLRMLSSPEGPIITLAITESEEKSMNAVYDRFLNYLKIGYIPGFQIRK
jgi:hypothetical protein